MLHTVGGRVFYTFVSTFLLYEQKVSVTTCYFCFVLPRSAFTPQIPVRFCFGYIARAVLCSFLRLKKGSWKCQELYIENEMFVLQLITNVTQQKTHHVNVSQNDNKIIDTCYSRRYKVSSSSFPRLWNKLSLPPAFFCLFLKLQYVV